MIKLVTANTTRLDEESNAAYVDCYDGGDAEDQREPYGELPMMCDLGSISIPFPPTAEGKAELLVAEGVGGANGRACAAWDTRTASIAGKLEPGDRCTHAPHPNKAAQILLKGEQRAVAIIVVDKNGKQSLQTLSADTGFTVLIGGHAMKLDKSGFAISSANGQHSISVTNQGIQLSGNVSAGPPGQPGETLGVATAAAWAAVGVRPVFGIKVGA
jgi:hypothetical protein